MIKHNLIGRTTWMYTFNPASGTALPNLMFREPDSTDTHYRSGGSIAVNSLRIYKPEPNDLNLPANQFYALQASGDSQPLALVAVEHRQSDDTMVASTNAYSTGSEPLYAPLVKKNWFGNSTGIVVQNLDSLNSETVKIFYYPRGGDGSVVYDSAPVTIPPLSTHSFWSPDTITPDEFVGSAVIDAQSGRPLAAIVGEVELGGSRRTFYNASLEGSYTVIVPRIYKNYKIGTVVWQTGIQVQNASNNATNVTVRYYMKNGDDTGCVDTASIRASHSVTFYQPNTTCLPDTNFVGSAVVTSGWPIVAVVNVENNKTGDTAMSYTGFNR